MNNFFEFIEVYHINLYLESLIITKCMCVCVCVSLRVLMYVI